jgi:hypothetical protein
VRAHQAVSLVVKQHIREPGLEVGDFSAHSLRAGFLTSAANRGASIFKMRSVSRHKSIDVCRAKYATPMRSPTMPAPDFCDLTGR